jgi:hypothetical protein
MNLRESLPIKAIDGFIPGCQKPQADNYRASKA